jgi:hypothetical protein
MAAVLTTRNSYFLPMALNFILSFVDSEEGADDVPLAKEAGGLLFAFVLGAAVNGRLRIDCSLPSLLGGRTVGGAKNQDCECQ